MEMGERGVQRWGVRGKGGGEVVVVEGEDGGEGMLGKDEGMVDGCGGF